MNRRTHSDFSWSVILVGCASLAVGIFFLSGIIGGFSLANRLSSGVEAQAKVIEVELETSPGGGRSGGQSSRTVATYEFELGGKTFRSDRLTIFANSRFLYEGLRQAKDSDQTVTCYVAREDPSLSALHTDFALWPFLGMAFFATVLGGVGVACFVQEIRNLTAINQGLNKSWRTNWQ
jgi:hypothetical protein